MHQTRPPRHLCPPARSPNPPALPVGHIYKFLSKASHIQPQVLSSVSKCKYTEYMFNLILNQFSYLVLLINIVCTQKAAALALVGT